MRNDTKSEIIITMRNLDHANRLYNFLEEALSIGDMGGDLVLSYDGAEKGSKIIGHDVSCKLVEHKFIEKEKI